MIAGGLLVAVGALLRDLPAHLYDFLRRQFTVTLHVNNSEPAFDWINVWLDRQPYARRSRLLSITTETGRKIERRPSLESGKHPTVFFTAAPGYHFLSYRGRLVVLSRIQEKEQIGTDWMQSKPRETLLLRVLGRDQSIVRELVRDAMNAALGEDRNGVPIYVSDGRWQTWKRIAERHKRSPESVVLPAGVMESLVADIEHFRSGRDFYTRAGIPYRRGYLLFGSPGSGKSSAVLAIASHFDAAIYIINLNAETIDDASLVTMLAQVPPGNVVLLEDVDAIFLERKQDDRKQSRVTFSGLLNALDGVVASEGRLLFLTTNHIDRLDEALIRPGRVDRRIRLGPATEEQIVRYVRHLFPEQGEAFACAFAAEVGDRRASMAMIQEHLLEHQDDPDAALRSANCIAGSSDETGIRTRGER